MPQAAEASRERGCAMLDPAVDLSDAMHGSVHAETREAARGLPSPEKSLKRTVRMASQCVAPVEARTQSLNGAKRRRVRKAKGRGRGRWQRA
eukprot:952476-Pleurochrysis_carterae.AAC.1